MHFLDPSYLLQNGGTTRMFINYTDFTEIPGDATTGQCYQLNLETLEGAREKIEQLNYKAAFLIKLQEDDLPKGQRAT